MADKIRILVAGCGNMGSSHARAYHKMDDFEIVGLVSRGAASRDRLNAELGGAIPTWSDFHQALAVAKPDAVSINTYPDTHAEFCLAAIEAGCHVFVEKPLAMTVAQAEAVVRAASRCERQVVVGYILRVHPSWERFIAEAQKLGKPLVMRMNLNQQSTGDGWAKHKALLNCMSPIVDCGVHYVDVMCQMTRSRPIRVQAIGARLSDDIDPDMYNYGQLQVVFNDGSMGWYEAGWGPMMSETAYFVKDVVGPNGSVTIMGGEKGNSNDIESHTRTNRLLVHSAAFDADGNPEPPDRTIDMSGEPDHQELCHREQAFFLRAIRENLDLTDHLADAVNSLRVVLAADRSAREGRTIRI